MFLIQLLTDCPSRRLARRGGVKRISATIYDDVRQALKTKLTEVGFLIVLSQPRLPRSQTMRIVIALVEYSRHKTITVSDIIFALNRVSL